ncbi:MAG: hypothetical protein FJ090_21685 [Deltaproteobacteria bacterium]|nr:hypothetical protein [Deltaproteobacteria bacterium]
MFTRFMVLGGPVPAALQAALTGVVEFVPDGAVPDDDVDGLLVHARPESLAVFRRFRRKGGSLPIFALADGPVEIGARVQWIRHGADDLLDPATAADTLRRKMKASHAAESAKDDAEKGMYLDRYLCCMQRYVAAREALLSRLGENELSRYLDCVFLRDHALRASEDAPADPFGQRRGDQREPLGWPVSVVEPVDGAGEILNVGADGCACAINVPPGDRLTLSVQTGAMSAELSLDVRWQRRVARDRWEFGGLIVKVQIA